MSQNVPQPQWMIKDTEGNLSGPHSLQAIIDLIYEGTLIGTEKISEYPGGLWKTLSQCHQFYDPLFSALANKNLPQKIEDSSPLPSSDDVNNQEELNENEDHQNLYTENISEESINKESNCPIVEDANIGSFSQAKKISNEKQERTMLVESISSKDKLFDTYEKHPSKKNILHSKSASNYTNQNSSPLPDFSNNELLPQHSKAKLPALATPITKKPKKAPKRKPRIFFIFFFIIISYFLLIDDNDNNKQDEKFARLIAPQKFNIGQLPQPEIRKRFQKAIKLFYRSTYLDYIKAQTELVDLAEQASDIPDILGLLCLTHRELWPYSKKTNQDLEAVSSLSQRISKVQAIGIHQDQCNIVKYLFSNQIKIAKDVINKVLEDYPNAPVLYDLKAEILAKEKKYSEAIAFIQRARNISSEWNSWLKLYIQEAEYQIADQKYIHAADILRPLHSKFPSHVLISVLLGYLDLRFLDNQKQGVELIQKGLQSEEVLLSKTYSKVTLALAQYHEKQKNPKMALDFAKKSYQKSFYNTNAENIILRLGGIKAIQSMQTTEDQLIATGDAFYNRKMFIEAQAKYQIAYEENPKSAKAALRAAKCLWELNLTEESIKWAKKALVADPKLVEAYTTLSDYLTQRYHFDAAIALLLRAAKRIPRNYKILQSIASVEFKRPNYKSAESFARKALKLNDADITTNTLLAEILYETKKYNEAFHIIAKSMEIGGNQIQIHRLYGKTIAAIKGEASGVKHLTGLINTYPNIVDYQIALSEVHLAYHNYAKAKDVLEKAIVINPEEKKAYMLLGETYSKMVDDKNALNKALKSYLQVAIKDPFDVRPLFEIGLIYMRTKKYADAIKQFGRVLRINESYPKAHFYQGTSYFFLGLSNQALAATKKEKQINPSLAEPYLLAGDIYMNVGLYKKAILEFQRAIKLRPQGAQIYVSLAKAYRFSNEFDVAEQMIKQAERLENGNPKVYKEQGAIYESRGEVQRAIAVYEQYLQISPNANDRQVIRSKISQLAQQ